MPVIRSRRWSRIPGLRQGMATLAHQPLTFHGHAAAKVVRARAAFLRTLGFSLDRLVLGRQVHGTRVRVVGEGDAGAGARTPASYLPATDGLLTHRPNLFVGLFTADCFPILLADPVSGWVGALHVGWRGIVRGIIPKAIRTLRHEGVQPKRVQVWVGPGICRQCYTTESKARVRLLRSALGSQMSERRGTRFHIDLRKAIRIQLLAAGIRPENIEVSAMCTKTSHNLPSARRQGPEHPNTLTVIGRAAAPHDLRGKRVVVFGLGTLGGGVASARYAAAQYAQVTVVDERPRRGFQTTVQQLRGLPISYSFGRLPAGIFRAADVIIANPGVQPDHPVLKAARKRGTVVTSDLAVFRAASQNPLIAITGTKGKSTVATWLHQLLSRRADGAVLAGNLQQSPLLLPKAFDGRTPVVLEVSSFQLEHTDLALQPKLSIVTNLYPDHLNRHGTMRAYAAVKAKLLANASPRSLTILPLDSEWRRFAPKLKSAKTFWTSLKPQRSANAWVEAGWIVVRLRRGKEKIVKLSDLRQPDAATQRNAVTVALAARLLNIPLPALRAGLRKFQGVAGRFEVVRRSKGRTFINSTTATNPTAALVAVQSVRGRCIVIAGGADKHLSWAAFARALNLRKIPVVLLPGTATKVLQRRLTVPTIVARTMPAAVRFAWGWSRSGDTILLAPGAASFGLFRNEFERGRQFAVAVRALP